MRAATRAARGKSKSRKGIQPVRAEFHPGMSPIPVSRQGAAGGGTNGTSMKQSIDVEEYEEQRKRRNARSLEEEDDRIFEQDSQEPETG